MQLVSDGFKWGCLLHYVVPGGHDGCQSGAPGQTQTRPTQPIPSKVRFFSCVCILEAEVSCQLSADNYVDIMFVFPWKRFDFLKSKLLFESFSNGSKSVNLVSHSLLAYDTRYSGLNKAHAGLDGTKPNVFDCILQPSKTGTNRASLQLELHYRYKRKRSEQAHH